MPHLTAELGIGPALLLSCQGLDSPPGKALLGQAQNEEAYAGDCIPAAGRALSTEAASAACSDFDVRCCPAMLIISSLYSCLKLIAPCILSMQHVMLKLSAAQAQRWQATIGATADQLLEADRVGAYSPRVLVAQEWNHSVTLVEA